MTDFAALLSADFPTYLRDLETLVNIDCGTHNKAGVDAVGRMVQARMREFGANVTEFPQDKYGNCLYARWDGSGPFTSSGARILLIGHMDTVYPDGTVQKFPFRRESSRALGPGVIDMKSGLLNGLYAIHALVRAGFNRFAEIGLFCNSEEEIGSPVSRELYAPFARRADVALILEPGRENGAIVSARKGAGTYRVIVHGRAAHAGVEPEKGANAILALAQYTTALHALNGLRPRLTVNVGVVHGGTRPNVVPETAEAEVDVRIARAEDAPPLEQAMREVLSRTVVPGTTAELIGGITNPPMEKTEASERLVAYAQAAARELGFEIQDVTTGGASDGNYTAALGTPTLDALGPLGSKAHNAREEWLNLDSVVPRAAMLAKLIVAIAEGALKQKLT